MKQRFLVQHESCECKFKLNESVFNSKPNGIMMIRDVGVTN